VTHPLQQRLQASLCQPPHLQLPTPRQFPSLLLQGAQQATAKPPSSPLWCPVAGLHIMQAK